MCDFVVHVFCNCYCYVIVLSGIGIVGVRLPYGIGIVGVRLLCVMNIVVEL